MAITRLAPSPTGALHLGNARTFLINWLLARKFGWKIQLRIEDLDGPRVKPGAGQSLVDDLRYLGLDWDSGPIYQSQRMATYELALARLMTKNMVYPCICTRREAELAASAPHAEDGASVYPGTCRGRFRSTEEAAELAHRKPALRFAVPDQTLEFRDGFSGNHRWNLASELGDFVVAKADGTPAYQLAVVVDDLAAGVTHVVRGDDLLDSTPRQMLLYQAMGVPEQIPEYFHLPLVVGPDGRRLAKRHGDTRVTTYEKLGVSRGRMLALLARWCGVDNDGSVYDPHLLIDRFELTRLSPKPIVFTESDDAFLRGKMT